MCFRRRLLHSELGAVAGLTGHVVGLRFSYAQSLAKGSPLKGYSINSLIIEQ